jgi:aconitate hydratase
MAPTTKILSLPHQEVHYYPLPPALARLPFSLKILLENLLRYQETGITSEKDVEAILNWNPQQEPEDEIAFTPARVVLQDFTGVPVVVDLAAMREAMKKLGGNVQKINPLSAVDLVIDHSVMVDTFGNNSALHRNTQIEFARNKERYTFLRWGQKAFQNFRVVPPGTGIVHQVNLEYLAHVVCTQQKNGKLFAYPDTLVGTDSHTTMINGLGVLGWGVGGIEAEAAMLGQPVTLLIPQVVGFEFTGAMTEGTTATDLVLRVVEILRKQGVVGKFVEFFGDGLSHLPLADRATIANMAPEYGATCGIFPIDAETLKFLRLSGRSESHIALVEAYAKAQGMFRENGQVNAEYSSTLRLDLSTVEPAIAGPKRPQDRINLSQTKVAFEKHMGDSLKVPEPAQAIEDSATPLPSLSTSLRHGDVVIAAITSCTNTSNPAVMLAAGLVAQKAIARGLTVKPWVKTSLAPGSQVVTDYLEKSNLMAPLQQLGFYLVGYGCTTCIGNSGPLLPEISQAIQTGELSVCAVLSGNRNFEGRIHPEVRNAYLASPPLVVAYALAGTLHINLFLEPLGKDKQGNSVFLKDIWPTNLEIDMVVQQHVKAQYFTERYAHVFEGTSDWQTLAIPSSDQYQWEEASTYIKNPPYFDNMTLQPKPIAGVQAARVLAWVGDSVTTDHISPAGDIAQDSPAGLYLEANGVAPADFNSYGSRRGNHEVMMRGTFANIRLKNLLVPGQEGGVTTHFDSGDVLPIFDAAMRYKDTQTPLIIFAGQEYGSGSSRDWAAKGTLLLGVRAVIAQSFERIHRSNLIGMGVLPLEFKVGENAASLGLTGQERYSLVLIGLKPHAVLTVNVEDGKKTRTFDVKVRIDTPKELEYYEHGGILPYVLRQLHE